MFMTRCSRLRKKMVQNKTIFSVHIVYMYIVYIYLICFYAHFNFSHVHVKYLFRNDNFCNENYPPPPPINLIFLVCCYSMSFHLYNNSNILACYIYIYSCLLSLFINIVFFCVRFVKNIPVFKKYTIIVLICKEHNIPVFKSCMYICTCTHVYPFKRF